jgi:HEAT repeat protein
MPNLRTVLAVALTASLVAGSARAHGGTYAGPGGGGTGAVCGPTRRSQLAPESVGPGAVPLTTSRPTSRAATDARALLRERRERAENELVMSWRMWWEWNEGRLLRLRLDETTPTSRPVDSAAFEAEILAALDVAASDPWWCAATGARVAFGKRADAGRSAWIERMAADLLQGSAAHDRMEVREATAVALACLGAVQATPALLVVLRGAESARIRNRDVPYRTRAIAAVALGDLWSRAAGAPRDDVRDALLRVATSDGEQELVRCGAIDGLGLLGDRAATAALVAVASDAAESDSVRARAATALGRLGGPEAASALVALLAAPARHVACAAAVGIGALGADADVSAVAALAAAARGADEELVRRFAAYALGELSSPVAEAALLERIGRTSGAERESALLAAGNYGLRNPDARARLGPAALAAFHEDKVAHDGGAAAIALGLLAYDPARATTAQALVACPNGELRGYYALALALHGAPFDGAARDVVRADVRQRRDLDLARRAAKALAHGGDAESLPAAIDFVRDGSDNLTALFDVAGACARRGGAAGLLAMLRAPRDAATPEWIRENARAAAAVGLGLSGERLVPPLRERIRTHAYYGASDAASAELSLYY